MEQTRPVNFIVADDIEMMVDFLLIFGMWYVADSSAGRCVVWVQR